MNEISFFETEPLLVFDPGDVDYICTATDITVSVLRDVLEKAKAVLEQHAATATILGAPYEVMTRDGVVRTAVDFRVHFPTFTTIHYNSVFAHSRSFAITLPDDFQLYGFNQVGSKGVDKTYVLWG